MRQVSQKPYFNELHVGMELPAAEFGPMDRLDYIPIAIILRDTNPLHLDRVYARERGLPDTDQQGPLNQSYLYRFFTEWLHDPWHLISTQVRLTANAFPGDILVCKGKVLELISGRGFGTVECDLWQENQDGATILKGKARGRMPLEP